MFLAIKLKKWVSHQLISEGQAQAILDFEKGKGLSRLFLGLGGLGALSIVLGIGSLIASNWYAIPAEAKIGSHVAVNLLLAFVTLKYFEQSSLWRELLVGLQAGLVMTFLALIGQVLQTQSDLWKPLAVWLVLVTPMFLLYARSSGLAFVWLSVAYVFGWSLGEDYMRGESQDLFVGAWPIVLYVLFNLKKINEVMPNWTQTARRFFWVYVIGATSLAQILWLSHNGHHYWGFGTSKDFVASSIAGAMAIVLLNVAQRQKRITYWVEDNLEWDVILAASAVFAALPILLPHMEMPVMGAIMFCLYWLAIGGAGLRLGIERLWSMAVIFVGLRLFIAYMEIFGSLALQGLGLIATGVIFLSLAWGAKKIIQNQSAKKLIPRLGGGQS